MQRNKSDGQQQIVAELSQKTAVSLPKRRGKMMMSLFKGRFYQMKVKYVLIGLAISFILIRVFHFAADPYHYQLFALFLAYTSCVYLGAALSDSRLNILITEAAVSLVIFSCAYLGMVYSPFWVALGYLLHGTWDLMHHPKLVSTKIVKAFPPLCVIVDFTVAVFIYCYFL
jgi:hypothetical protein